MPRWSTLAWGLWLLLMLGLGLAGCAGPAPAPPGVTVESVNLVLYQGRWFEIASTQPLAQQGCVCTQARYTLHGREMVLENTCRELSPQGREYRRVHLAEPIPGTGDAQLAVTYTWPIKSAYWVIGLDPDYQWALVGSPDRQDLWVLSRQPRLCPEVYARLIELARQKGYDPDRLRMTPQDCAER